MNSILLVGPFSGMTGTQLAMLVLAVIFLTILMISTGKKIRESRALTGLPARERYAELESRQSTRRGVEQATIELDKVARQVHAQIDTKLVRLEVLIRDADKRIAELSSKTGDQQRPAPFEVTLREETPVAGRDNSAEPSDERYASIYQLADEGLTVRQIAAKVDRVQGEVELILGLRRADPSSAGTNCASASPSR